MVWILMETQKGFVSLLGARHSSCAIAAVLMQAAASCAKVTMQDRGRTARDARISAAATDCDFRRLAPFASPPAGAYDSAESV
jgi:hypothetical protein